MIVPISEGEAFQIWRWARERLAAKHPNARSRRFSPLRKDDFSIHFDGVKGEYAVSKLFMLPYDPDPRPGGDKGEPDLVLPNGLTVQIKFREKPEYDFALTGTDPKEFNTDVGILVARASPDLRVDDVKIVGWITRDEFLRVASIQNYTQRADGQRLAANPEHFFPIETLLAEIYALAA